MEREEGRVECEKHLDPIEQCVRSGKNPAEKAHCELLLPANIYAALSQVSFVSVAPN